MDWDFKNVSFEGGIVADGEYNSTIEKAEWKVSKAGPEYLNLTFKILEGNHTGKFVFNMYNLFNTNEQAKNIALQDMKRLLVAVGVDAGGMSKESLVSSILGKQILLKVGNRTDDYGLKNIVKGYKKATLSEQSLPF
jgi:hypothetical protein